MTLQEMLQAYVFEEIYPEIGLMYQPARKQRELYRRVYDALINIKAVTGKKAIRYELMHDPDTQEYFYGADDRCFQTTWEALAGKQVKKDSDVDLTPEQMLANCLLNAVLIARKPKGF